MCGFTSGWSGWDVQYKLTHCCRMRGLGCPLDESIQPMAGIGKLNSGLQGCPTQCLYKGVSASCARRIMYVSRNQHQTCEAANNIVQGQCSFCSVCPLEQSGCGAATTRLFEAPLHQALPGLRDGLNNSVAAVDAQRGSTESDADELSAGKSVLAISF